MLAAKDRKLREVLVKTWQKVLLILIVVFGLGVFLMLVAIYQSLTAPPQIRSGSVLLQPVTQLVEWRPTDLVSRVLTETQPTLRDVVDNLRKAAVDDRVTAVVLLPRGEGYGWAKAAQLRRAMAEFKRSGKPLIAFIERAQDLAYFLASAAERVYMVPSGDLMLNGLTTQVVFLRGTLDKLGVYPDLEHIGDYKSASDLLTRKSMSGPHREMMNAILDSYYAHYVDSLAASRDKDAEEIRRIIDDHLFLKAKQALEYGLVDSLLFWDELEQLLKKNNNGTFRKLSAKTYYKIPTRTLGLDKGPKIALIYAMGSIILGNDSFDPIFGSAMGSSRVAADIHRAAEDKTIKAIVFRVDSPGGDALASDIIWKATQTARQKKPFIVSMSDVAGSGGYWISMGADSIVAEAGTLTGSIGVISGKFSLASLYDKIDLNVETLKRGRFADAMTDTRPFTPEEREQVIENMWWIYRMFVTKAAEGRGMTYDQVDALGRGRVWTGAQAKQNGLVDVLGGLETAIDLAKQKAGIAPEESVRLVVYPREKSLVEMVLSQELATVFSWWRFPAGDPVIEFFRGRRLYRNFTSLAIMPWWLQVN